MLVVARFRVRSYSFYTPNSTMIARWSGKFMWVILLVCRPAMDARCGTFPCEGAFAQFRREFGAAESSAAPDPEPGSG